MQRTYSSKRDRWLMTVIWISTIVVFGNAAALLDTTGGSLLEKLAITVPMCLLFVVVLIGAYSTSYTLVDEALLIRSFPFRWNIPLSDILDITPSRNPLSSPAMSLDRLEIRYRKGGREHRILISPQERDEFLADLASRSPAIQIGET